MGEEREDGSAVSWEMVDEARAMIALLLLLFDLLAGIGLVNPSLFLVSAFKSSKSRRDARCMPPLASWSGIFMVHAMRVVSASNQTAAAGFEL